MKTTLFLLAVLTGLFLATSCKKEAPALIIFTNNTAEGTADGRGEFTITGHISSPLRLTKVDLYKQGQATPFFVDDSTVKNKTEYDFAYKVTSVTSNINVTIDIFNQNNKKITTKFLVKKI